jgi:hypothetical protein
MIREIADGLMQLDRMHQLNLELLEQLDITCRWLAENITEIPNIDKMRSLLAKTNTLLTEIYSKNPSDEFLQGDESDDKLTEPILSKDLSFDLFTPVISAMLVVQIVVST